MKEKDGLSHRCVENEGKKMKNYVVYQLILSTGQTAIEAESLGDAYEKARDLTAGDFDFMDGSDTWLEIREQEDDED